MELAQQTRTVDSSLAVDRACCFSLTGKLGGRFGMAGWEERVGR